MTLLETASGVLSVNSIGERPNSIIGLLSDRTPTIIIFPDIDADITAELYLTSGERVDCPENIRATLSYYLLALRGMPRESLIVRVGKSISELPRIQPYSDGYKYISQSKYHISYQNFTTSGGIECRLATVRAETSSRIIMLDNEPNATFLKGLRVIKGFPDCERVIAVKRREHDFFFTSTDKTPTLDAALALTVYLGSETERGEIHLKTDRAEYHTLFDKERPTAYLRFSHIG